MKPIILTADEVRAALAGTLTEIRRPVEPMPGRQRQWLTREKINEVPHGEIINGGWQMHHPKAGTFWMGVWHEYDSPLGWIRSPLGAPGDVLWCRETYARLLAVSPATGEPLPITAGEQLIEPPTQWTDSKGVTHWNYDGRIIAYRANSDVEFCDGDGFSGEMADRSDMPRWQSPVTMPLRFSRLALVTRSVRVERADVWTWVGGVEVGRKENGEPMPPREVKS